MCKQSRVAALHSRGGTSLAWYAVVDPKRRCLVRHSLIYSLIVLPGRAIGCPPSARSWTGWDRDATARYWPVAEINPRRPKRRLSGKALAAKVNSRAGSRRRTTGQEPSSRLARRCGCRARESTASGQLPRLCRAVRIPFPRRPGQAQEVVRCIGRVTHARFQSFVFKVNPLPPLMPITLPVVSSGRALLRSKFMQAGL